jgi:putative ABC transport system permease protein
MTKIAWRMLAFHPLRLAMTWAGLGFLLFLSQAQLGMLIGWCATCTAIIRHSGADLWVMAKGTCAFDYGGEIPLSTLYKSRSVPGVLRADPMMMTWNFWQSADGRRTSIELVGLDADAVGGPWNILCGAPDATHIDDGVIIDELYLAMLGVTGLGDEAELYGQRAVVRGICSGIRTLTASPFVFTSLSSARKFDTHYSADEITYVMIRCADLQSMEAVRTRLLNELVGVEVLTGTEFEWRTILYWMLETGLGMTVVLTAALGFAVSTLVGSQVLFAVTQENLANYATLSALGFTAWQHLKCIVCQALLLTLGGVLIALGLFQIAAGATARTPVPLEMTLNVQIMLLGLFLITGLAATAMSMRLVLGKKATDVFLG